MEEKQRIFIDELKLVCPFGNMRNALNTEIYNNKYKLTTGP